MEKPSPNSSGSRELQCVGRLEILKPKPVGFLCGSVPVPTDRAFHVFNSALVPSTQTLRAPRYRMLPNETDLNTLPLLSSIPEKILPIAAVQSRTSGDHGSTSDPAVQSSTSAPYLIPISQRRQRRRSVFAVEMGRQKAVAKDLLANIPDSVDAQSAPTQPKPKTKRIKKAQPKTKGWVEEMAAYMKSIDNQHLLEIGMEGFYGDSKPERKLVNPSYQVGTDFIRSNLIKDIDFTTIHAYPDIWLSGQNENPQMAFMQKWVENNWADSGKIVRKPLVITEFGKSGKDPGLSVFTDIDNLARNGGNIGGSLVWQLMAQGVDPYFDGYQIILSEDPSTD